MTELSTLRTFLAEVIDTEPENISDGSHLIDDLGVDSLMIFEIMVSLEKKFHVKFLENDLAKISDVRSLHKILIEKEANHGD